MNYPVNTPIQLRAVLRALRKTNALTQQQAGDLLGVNQRRAAKIEANPEVTSFGQISRLVSALGGRLVITTNDTPVAPTRKTQITHRAHGMQKSISGVKKATRSASQPKSPKGTW